MKRILSVLAATGVALSVATPAEAITWGQFDGEDHPHVVNLLFVQNGEGYFSCTGTLLDGDTVLTAGHCAGALDENGDLQANDATYVTNAPDINVLIAETRGDYASTAAWLEGEWVQGQAVPHPQYAEYAEFPDTFDIGVVELESAIDTGGVYGEIPDEGAFDYLRRARTAPSHRRVEIVGYGLVGRIPAFADDEVWQRQVGFSTIINTGQSNQAGPQNFVFTNNRGNGTGGSGTCSGDSGGPAFWVDPATGEPTNVIVAVNSYSVTPNCNGNDYQFRTDTAVAQEFLGQFDF